MGIKLYLDLMSQPARALYLFLKLNKIPFTECQVALRKGEHLTDEYEAINPFKKVPAIDHNGFKLGESIAIIRYITREKEFKVADHWYPANSKLRAKVDQYLEWQHLNTRLYGSMVFQTTCLIPFLSGQPPNEKRVKFFSNGLSDTLDIIEKTFLQTNSYLAGNEISVADIFCACELEQPLAIGFDLYADHPNLHDWMKRVNDRLNPEYDQAHKLIRGIPKKMMQKMAEAKL